MGGKMMDVVCVLHFVHVLRDVTGDHFLKASEYFTYPLNNIYCTMIPHVQDLQSMAVSFLHTTPLQTHNTTLLHSTQLPKIPLHYTQLLTIPLHYAQLPTIPLHYTQLPTIPLHYTQLQQLGLSPTCLSPLSTQLLCCHFLNFTLFQRLVNVLPDFLEGCVCATIDLPPLCLV